VILDWYYFGCHKQPGHDLFLPGMAHPSNYNLRQKLCQFDGVLCPRWTREQGAAVISRLPGIGASALSFWDYTVDRRPGSNSNFFAPSPDIAEDEFLFKAKQLFPEVWERVPAIWIVQPPRN
jgi:hypothetical protein